MTSLTEEQAGSRSIPVPRWTLAFVVALVACGSILRFYRLGSNSLWIDEYATLRIALLPFADIFAENLSNNSFEPPIYFWLTHGVARTFGDSEATIRLPSAIAGSLTIPVVWLIMRDLSRSLTTAHVTAALLALNPLHLWYSQEARPYAFLVLAASLAIYFLVQAMDSAGRRGWLGFTVFATLAVLTHLVGILVLAVAWAWCVLDVRRRQLARSLLRASAVILGCTAPLVISIALATAQIPGTGSPPRPTTGLEIPYTLLCYVAGYSFGPSLRDIQNIGPLAALAAHPFESALAIVAVTGSALLAARHYRTYSVGLAILLAAYVGLIFLVSVVTGKAFSVRYTLPGLVGFLGMISVAGTRGRVGWAWPTFLLVLFTWADIQWFSSPTYWKDDTRATAKWLAERLPPGSEVAVAPGYAAGILGYYAERENARLRIVPAGPDGRWTVGAPAALVVTRLHHLPDSEQIVSAFRRRAGGDLISHRGIGYDVYVDEHRP
jgi:uncharacterized membrane protein